MPLPFHRLLLLAGYALLPALASGAPRWAATLDEATGLPTLEASGEYAMSTSFAFWGANWKWAGLQPRVQPAADGAYEGSGKSALLDLSLQTHTAHRPDGSWTVDFTFDGGSGRPDVTGGLAFHLDPISGLGALGDPVLLPDNRGWRWGKDGGPQVEVRFDRPLAALYFEKPAHTELRALFFQGPLPAGTTTFRSTWTMRNVETLAPLRERLGGDPANWPVDRLSNDGAVPDLSFLNGRDKPAGRRGPVRSIDGRLVFADGSPAHFWGTNVAAYALFASSKDEVRAQAHRLAELGYNLVRIHHHDSPWVGVNVFGKFASVPDTSSLDEAAMDKIDWWIKCLKDEGIYVWLDLHVQRALKAGDRIEGFDEIRKGKDVADLKGYAYVNPSIQQAMQRFDEAYLTHRNPYTGTSYKDEPAVLAMALTNEDDLTQHYGNALLPDKKVPYHDQRYMDAAQDFARRSGLPKDKVWHSWEPGPSKLFLNDLEHQFDATMIAGLHKLGTKALVSTTSSWGDNPVSSLPALTTGDLVDVHAYGHYGTLEKSPLVSPNFADWVGAAHVVGYPVSVSEWNADPFPTQDRHVMPLYIAATASHQGWDALMHFAYAQEPPSRNHPSNWNAYNDPSLLAMMPAAALLYRERHVAEARTTYVLDLASAVFFGPAVSAATSPAIRTAMTKGRLLVAMPRAPELPWLVRKEPPPGATVLRDPAQSLLPADANRATTDTGELTRDWGNGVFTIDTARTRAALGWIGGRTIALGEVEVRLQTRNASVAVQSLDDQPIGHSRSLLVSVGTRSQPQPGNKAPFLVEPAAGTVSVTAPAGLKVWALLGSGKPVAWPFEYRDGRYAITLDGKSPVHWLFVRATS